MNSRTALGVVLALVLTSACGMPIRSEAAGSTSIPDPTASAAPPAPSATPVLPPLPSLAEDYQARLGPYADMLLRGGLVPWGSYEARVWLVECLRSAGWDAELGEHGSITATVGTQEASFRAARQACWDAAFSIGLMVEPEAPSSERLAADYDALQLTYQCLTETGYAVASPPSRDSYVESRGSAWDPWSSLTPAQWERAQDTCPADILVAFEWLVSGERPWR